jgi:hypothetical protein
MLVGGIACACGQHLTWRCECGAVTYGPALTNGCSLLEVWRASADARLPVGLSSVWVAGLPIARPASVRPGGTVGPGRTSKTGVDDDERQALRDQGLNPDNPAVIAAIDLVRWELSLGTTLARHLSHRTRPTGVRAPRPGHRVGRHNGRSSKVPAGSITP